MVHFLMAVVGHRAIRLPATILTALATASTTAGAGLSLFVGASPVWAQQQSQRADLAGLWRYNPEESDDFESQMPDAQGAPGGMPGRSGRPPGGGMPPGGRGGMGGRDGGMGGPPGGMSEEGLARMRQTMELARQAPQLLDLRVTDSTVSLVDPATSSVLLLYLDGRKFKQKVEGGGEVEIKAQWDERPLVLERKVSGGGKVTEGYTVSEDGRHLFVRVRVEGGRMPRAIEFRRAYDRDEG